MVLDWRGLDNNEKKLTVPGSKLESDEKEWAG